MSVKYSVVMRKNPAKSSEPGKYYAHAQAYGEMDFDSLCEEVNGRCTVTRADVAAAVEAILESMKKARLWPRLNCSPGPTSVSFQDLV